MELPNPSFHLASLLRWLGTFNISVPHNSVENLSDGVALAQALKQIDASWFDDNWLAKIKPDVGTNWRLKVSNLKKVLERVVDYYQESLGHSLAAFTLPDVNRIGEHGDRTETARLLQLVLGCAIYCDRKEDYIQNIMRLEEDVQQGIMRAIQELEASGMGGDSLAGFTGASSVASKQVLLDALEVANEAKEQLSQRCQKLDQQLEAMQAERVSLQNEIERLQELLQERDGQSDVSGPAQPASDVAFRYRDLRQQVETLREEVYRLESSKEEYRVRAESLERELETLRSRQDELVSAAESARSLKDEVDILREAAGRAAKAEATAEGLRKRAEEYTELKRQMRRLEEKNEELLNQNLVLEEEVKKAGPWKSQLDLHKKQIAELQDHLSQERQKVDKFEFQSKKLQEKLDTLQLEKERLARERDTLKEANEELRFAQLATGGTPTPGLNLSDENCGLETVDMIPPEVREKLLRLQRENARLLESRSKAVQENGCAEEEKAVLQATVDDLKQREADLETQNRCVNHCRHFCNSFAHPLPPVIKHIHEIHMPSPASTTTATHNNASAPASLVETLFNPTQTPTIPSTDRDRVAVTSTPDFRTNEPLSTNFILSHEDYGRLADETLAESFSARSSLRSSGYGPSSIGTASPFWGTLEANPKDKRDVWAYPNNDLNLSRRKNTVMPFLKRFNETRRSLSFRDANGIENEPVTAKLGLTKPVFAGSVLSKKKHENLEAKDEEEKENLGERRASSLASPTLVQGVVKKHLSEINFRSAMDTKRISWHFPTKTYGYDKALGFADTRSPILVRSTSVSPISLSPPASPSKSTGLASETAKKSLESVTTASILVDLSVTPKPPHPLEPVVVMTTTGDFLTESLSQPSVPVSKERPAEKEIKPEEPVVLVNTVAGDTVDTVQSELVSLSSNLANSDAGLYRPEIFRPNVSPVSTQVLIPESHAKHLKKKKAKKGLKSFGRVLFGLCGP